VSAVIVLTPGGASIALPVGNRIGSLAGADW